MNCSPAYVQNSLAPSPVRTGLEQARQCMRPTFVPGGWTFRSFGYQLACNPSLNQVMRADSRRLAYCIGLIIASFVMLFEQATAESIPTKQPNVVLLYADDMGYGDLAIQNLESKIRTPHLDRLAASGTRFTDAHSSSGICTPSRYALLQGRYHWRKFHGIVNSFDPPVLDKNAITLPEMLKQAGYRTACIGKWHLGWDWDAIRDPQVDQPKERKETRIEHLRWDQKVPGGPLDHGFDYYFGDDVPNFPPYAWIENDRLLAIPSEMLKTSGSPREGAWETRPGPAVSDWDFHAVMPTLTDKAKSWLEMQSADQPFFLYFPFTSPHAPIVPEDSVESTSQAGAYGDFVAQTDKTVGAILDTLERLHFSDNTIVIFTSDNGPEHYAYDRTRNFGHSSSGLLRGVKRDLWEGGHRVPFLVKWPGQVEAGRVSDGLLSQIDIFATLAELANQPIPERFAEDTKSQCSLWLGEGPSARRSLVHNTNSGQYAIRSGDWLLVDTPSGGVTKMPDWFRIERGYSKSNTPGELFQLSNDLGQYHNLYQQYPEVVERLKMELAIVLESNKNP